MVVTETGEQGTFVRYQSRTIAVVHFPNEHVRVESQSIPVSRIQRAPLPVIDDPNAPPEETVTVSRARHEELLEDLRTLKENAEELEERVGSFVN